MNISKRKRIFAFFVWLFIVPLCVYIAMNYFPAGTLDWFNITVLFGVLLLTALVPLRVGDTMVSLERWVIFTVFLQYGFFTQLILMQFALVFLLHRPKRAVPKLHRFFVRSFMHTIIGLVSASVFHLSGGGLGMLQFPRLLVFASLYAVVYTAAHHLVARLLSRLGIRSFTFTGEVALWDYIVTMVTLSFSISLYLLNEQIGNESIILVAIPFFIVLIVMNMYSRANTLNEKLEAATKMGHELANQLRYDDMLKLFLEKLKEIVPFDNAYIFEVKGKKRYYELLGAYENGKQMSEAKQMTISPTIRLDHMLNKETAKIYATRKELEALNDIRFHHPVENVMIAPIHRHSKLKGVIVLTAGRPYTFQKVEAQIVLIIASYFAMLLGKARFFEKKVASAEKCGLTKLDNYETLVLKLVNTFKALERSEIDSLSVIMLDIDHFKKVNDTYGHESGNDLLIQLAELLRQCAEPSGTVARYGGEEFVVILPGVTKIEAARRAEQLRRRVESHLFSVKADLSASRKSIEVNMTISLGVATGPEDANNAQDLLRNADRALYIGGKQAGRNRVGIHSS